MGDAGTAARTIRVLVVDDHPLMLSGVAALVRGQADMRLCGEATSAEETLERAMSARPDVIVLDLRLRGGVQNGIELASALEAMLPASRVLVYSGHLTESGIRELTRAGIAGYIPKTAPLDKLAQAIRTVGAGGRFSVIDGVAVGAPLAERELAALQLLAEGLENDEVAERLSLSLSSVRLCLTSAFAKLGARNRTDAVVRAHRMGMITID